jgi:exoribonuclease R
VELATLQPQIRFELDGKTPKALVQEDHVEMHSTIAEFMIWCGAGARACARLRLGRRTIRGAPMLRANSDVAHFLHLHFPTCSLLRHHPPPMPHRFQELLDIASAKVCSSISGGSARLQRAAQGLTIDVSSNGSLARSLLALDNGDEMCVAIAASGERGAVLFEAVAHSPSGSVRF